MKILPVILSGGSGTRLWPLSREQYPKQLIPLVGEDSLLQATVNRLNGFHSEIEVATQPYVVCNEEYRFLTSEQLRQIQAPAKKLILEPSGRNTAPAMTLAALAAASDESEGGDAILLVMAADHVVKDLDQFHRSLADAVSLASNGYIVTFGVVPTWAETGYGYIQGGTSVGSGQARTVRAFVEKPDAATAEKYVESGEFYWNSGIFVVKASVWNAAINQYRPDIFQACKLAMANAHDDGDFFRVDKQAFLACPSESIDYAVMEKLPGDPASGLKLAMVPLDAGWSDVGAWDALWQVCDKDQAGNVVRGDVLLHDTGGSMVLSQGRLVACIGIQDVVVVETADAVMVVHKDCTQDVKKVVEVLRTRKRSEAVSHRKMYRPWGYYDSIDHGERFQVKRIVVNPGSALSLQLHHHRAEHWVVVKGTAKVTRGDQTFLISENESTFIPIGVTHRLENPGKFPLEIIEVQSGSYLGEDDIVRFDDTYGRS